MPKNVVGSPARGDDLYGRDGDVDALWALLDRGSVLLAAPRRYGKTSIMFALADRPRAGSQVVQIDVEAIEHPVDLFVSLLAEVAQIAPLAKGLRELKQAPSSFLGRLRGVVDEVGVAGIKLKLREEVKPEDWARLGESVFEQLAGAATKVLVILDEFPVMVSRMLDQDHDATKRFLHWFRAQRQLRSAGGLRFLLGGSMNIEPRLSALGLQPSINDLEHFEVEPFSDEVAVEFVTLLLETELAGVGDATPDGTAEEVTRLLQTGVPYFLQAFVNEYLNERRRRRRPIAVHELEGIYRERLLGAAYRGRFGHYQSRLKEHYGAHEEHARIVLDELARHPARTSDELGASLDARSLDASVLDEVLVRLDGDYYIDRAGDEVRFSSNLLRDWWRANVPSPRRPR